MNWAVPSKRFSPAVSNHHNQTLVRGVALAAIREFHLLLLPTNGRDAIFLNGRGYHRVSGERISYRSSHYYYFNFFLLRFFRNNFYYNYYHALLMYDSFVAPFCENVCSADAISTSIHFSLHKHKTSIAYVPNCYATEIYIINVFS